jgi:replicative superfamily II helicase
MLARMVPFGVAFHHGGLSLDERALIEEAYLGKLVDILVCTSTLAAGVNLPARRVVVKELRMGRRELTKAEYQQMAGRAGMNPVDRDSLLKG